MCLKNVCICKRRLSYSYLKCKENCKIHVKFHKMGKTIKCTEILKYRLSCNPTMKFDKTEDYMVCKYDKNHHVISCNIIPKTTKPEGSPSSAASGLSFTVNRRFTPCKLAIYTSVNWRFTEQNWEKVLPPQLPQSYEKNTCKPPLKSDLRIYTVNRQITCV